MHDPVSGFEYPQAWIQACTSPDELHLAEKGYAVLTSSGKILKRGFTTGTTAAAVAKAAVISLSRNLTGLVSVLTPSGVVVSVPVTGANGCAFAAKYSGDYPSDVTAGALFKAHASTNSSSLEDILLETGEGIGVWARETPRYPKGASAISKTAREEILYAIQEVMIETGITRIAVILSVINGEEIAKKTLNSKVGVSHGISVLGSTGLVEPWDDHLEESTLEQVKEADYPVLTTGRIGMRYARMLFPDHQVILVGSKIGPALSVVTGKVILCGLPALILKHINPSFLDQTGFLTIEEMSTTPGFFEVMKRSVLSFQTDHPAVHVLILNRAGETIGDFP